MQARRACEGVPAKPQHLGTRAQMGLPVTIEPCFAVPCPIFIG